MKSRLLTVAAACALASMAHAQTSTSGANSGSVSGSSSTSAGNTTNNTSNNNSNPTANSNSGSSSGSVSNATGGQGGQAIGNNGNNQSNNRANSTSNSSTASTASANNAGNNQNNASSSKATGGTAIAGGGAGGQGGQGGVGVGGQGGIGVGGSAGINANISPSTNITFTGPPVSTSNVNTRTSGETTQNLNQSYTGRTEQVLSGETYQYIDYGGTQTIKNVPNVNAPPLTSSNDTCMGSASGGFSVPGLGISAGSTYTDEHCKRIKMSRELWNKGMKAASLAMDCMDPSAREALELTGFVCPQTTRTQQRAAAASSEQRAAAANGGKMASSSRVPTSSDPSREQPGFAEPAPVPTQVAEPQKIAAAASPDDSVTVRRVDLPIDGSRTLPWSEGIRSQR